MPNDYPIECVNCGKREVRAENTWNACSPGWGCLYGMLACCSRKCAEEYAVRESRYGVLRDGDFDDTNR